MRKHSIYSLALSAVLCTVLATGCSKGVELTAEQNNAIANYAARLIVKTTRVDYTYIPDIKDVDDTMNVDDETETDENGNVIAQTHDYSVLAEYMDMEGIEITYKDCIIGKEYPDDGATLFVVEAEPGNQLVAVEYNFTNITADDITYSISGDEPVFRLKTGSRTIMSFKNLLKNDLSNLKNFTIGAGQTVTAVVVFEVTEDVAADIKDIEVLYGNGGSSLPKERR